MTPYNTMRLDPRHHAFVQTTEDIPPRASPTVKQGLWVLRMVLRVIGYNKGAAPLGMLREGAECMLRGMGSTWETSAAASRFYYEPKTALKNKILKKKRC